MSTKEFEEMLDYYATEIKDIIKEDSLKTTFKSLKKLKKDIESERDKMQAKRWEEIVYDERGEDCDDDDWEISNYGIDPELGGRYGIDFDDEVGFRD